MTKRKHFLLIGATYLALLVLFSVTQTNANSNDRKIGHYLNSSAVQ